MAALWAMRSWPGGTVASVRDPEPLAILAEPAIAESSELAASRTSPGVIGTHNDSGGGLLFYATDRAGRPRGTYAVSGVDNVDWKDLAPGPGADALDRVAEPAVPDGRAPAADPTPNAPTERFPLVFPDGPRDVEALLVHPATGEVVMIPKEAAGDAVVDAAPLGAGGPVTAARVEAIPLPGIGSATAITGGAADAVRRRRADPRRQRRDRGGPVAATPRRRPAADAAGEARAYGPGGEPPPTGEGEPCPLDAVERDG